MDGLPPRRRLLHRSPFKQPGTRHARQAPAGDRRASEVRRFRYGAASQLLAHLRAAVLLGDAVLRTWATHDHHGPPGPSSRARARNDSPPQRRPRTRTAVLREGLCDLPNVDFQEHREEPEFAHDGQATKTCSPTCGASEAFRRPESKPGLFRSGVCFLSRMTAHENGGSTMRFVIGVLLILWRAGNLVAAQDVPGAGPCRVTEPNGSPVTEVAPGFYGDRELSVALMWPAGTVVFKPGGPGVVLRDGSLSMKFGWQRGIPGALTIDGHRIDGTALP